MTHLQADGIQVGYDTRPILDQLSVTIPQGQITTIIGANGCGKSTLLKALTRLLPLTDGQVILDGQNIATLPTKAVAKKIALLPQVLGQEEHIKVYDLVAYGRYPHQSFLGSLSDKDKACIDWALDVTGTQALKDQPVDALSGGQRQRVWIAMALAQDTDTIFLDEPTTYLDLNHQLEILELLKELNETTHKTIVMVLHDLNLSARFSDYLIAMKDGQIITQGSVWDVMTADHLKDIFQIQAELTQDPITHRPILLTYRLV
ncbi:ABC transporter ATP-binding protein [Streptococcus sp. DD12]|uniref:ABC transporter ATP-binding protein n=1 Tax=Streptococcus sp. DD12 TaxID=1777880 RepID=UPI000797E915|nr:ABC transporter ATP-binding protein [Streptococcus sp. DD12]KXT75826.1 Ferrichrome transport ATP-binding protein FhuC [Streptococcus sp. DD12]